jgi:diaminopimelate decarboxylase
MAIQLDSLIASGRDCAPPLAPKLAPWMRKLIEHSSTAKSLVDLHGSPVHAVVTSEFKRNIKDLLNPIKSRNLSGGIFFARKANKLPWFVTAAKDEGIGVDTASLREVEETLALGVPPERIVVTAVGKDRALLAAAVSAGCLLVLDNHDELTLLASVAEQLGKAARVGLRFSGFEVNGRMVFSRFGFPIDSASALLEALAATPLLKLEILHAHLDRYDIEERATAAMQLAQLADHARIYGHNVTGVDLGGGILIRYLESSTEWNEFCDALTSSVRGERPYFTYLNDGLGYYMAGDQLSGKADLYPAWNSLSKERFISSVLDHPVNGSPLHKQLSQRNLQIFFEPGRALLDNTGITLTSVAFRKRDTLGHLLVGTAMNRTNLRPFRAEFCTDPILLADGPREQMSEGAFIVGSLCSEGDIIFRRKIRLGILPQPGDILCFANTSGYLMHHLEVGTHGNTLPNNLLIDPDTLDIRDVSP